MRKKLDIIVISILLLSYLTYLKLRPVTEDNNSRQTSPTTLTNTAVPAVQIEKTATFKIITKGTTRIFTDSKYHNLSDDVYITSKDPNKIEIRKENITWSDFFKTLPMSLDKNCLVTGTKQTFCTNEIKKLYFYINNIEAPNALDSLIKQDDFLLVEYK